MKAVHKNQTVEHKNSDKCIATEYPAADKDINGAVIKLTGRYPDQGRVYNKKCKELTYILRGSAKVIVENEEVTLNEGGMVIINPNERYYWEGTATLFVAATPAWYPEQHSEAE